jgi:putative phosphoesterase
MRILIISDVHGNWEALRAVLQEPHDKVIFLGDAVHFGPQPHECVEALREHATWAVCGNHDHGASFDVDCRAYGNWKAWDDATLRYTSEMLTADDLAFLKARPIIQRVTVGDTSLCLVHAAATDPLYHYVSPDAPEAELAQELALADADVMLVGHSHVPMKRHTGRRMIVNPGSVGLPRAGAGAQYAIWNDGEITLRSIPYDVPAVVEQLRALRLPDQVFAPLIAVLEGRPPTAGPAAGAAAS